MEKKERERLSEGDQRKTSATKLTDLDTKNRGIVIRAMLNYMWALVTEWTGN